MLKKLLKVQERTPGADPVIEFSTHPTDTPAFNGKKTYRVFAIIGTDVVLPINTDPARRDATLDLARRHITRQVYGGVRELTEEILLKSPSREIVELCHKILNETEAP